MKVSHSLREGNDEINVAFGRGFASYQGSEKAEGIHMIAATNCLEFGYIDWVGCHCVML